MSCDVWCAVLSCVLCCGVLHLTRQKKSVGTLLVTFSRRFSWPDTASVALSSLATCTARQDERRHVKSSFKTWAGRKGSIELPGDSASDAGDMMGVVCYVCRHTSSGRHGKDVPPGCSLARQQTGRPSMQVQHVFV
jgi:hypothetical protein